MRRRRTWSLRTRLSVIAAAAVALTALAVCGAAWLVMRRGAVEQADKELQTISRGPIGRIDPRTLTASDDPPLGDPGQLHLQVLTPAGGVVAPPGQVVRLPVTAADRTVLTGRAGYVRYTAEHGGERFRVLTFRGDRGAVQIARSLRDADAAVRRMGWLMALLATAAAGAAAATGRLIARTGLRPIDRLTDAAARVAATQDLQRPIEVLGDDEIARLGRAFNAMLAALDRSRRDQRRLVEDVAHELRTPMTSLRANIELLLRAGDALTDADREALLRDLRTQSEELGDLVTELVTLGRLDAADDPEVPLDLGDVVRSAAQRARARSRRATITVTGRDVPVVGRAAALERMALNLLDNAVKFGPAGGVVDVGVGTVAGGDPRAELLVQDRGPGIDAAERDRVFARFYRADTARSAPGSGLGLAIVQHIAESHGGEVRIDGRPGGGTTVRVRLPAAPRR